MEVIKKKRSGIHFKGTVNHKPGGLYLTRSVDTPRIFIKNEDTGDVIYIDYVESYDGPYGPEVRLRILGPKHYYVGRGENNR